MSVEKRETWCYQIRGISHGLETVIRVHGISREGISNEVVKGERR